MSQSHGSSHASDSLCDSGQGSIYSDSGSASDQDINSSDSASSDFSATSATSFNHGLLLSALRAIHLELQRLNVAVPHEQHRRARWRESTRNPHSGSSDMLAEGLVE